MPQQHRHSPELSVADRKKLLLADGALYRAKIMAARADIADGVQPGALARDAIGRLSATAQTVLLDTFRGGLSNPRTLSPLLMTGLSLLSKAWIRKPLIYAGVAGGAIAGILYLKKAFGDSNEAADDTTP